MCHFHRRINERASFGKGVIKIGSVPVFVGDADFKTVIVKVYEAAPEMPDTVLIGRLSHYGRVFSFRRDRSIATGILNGVRTVRMRLSKTVPSAIRVAGESVFMCGESVVMLVIWRRVVKTPVAITVKPRVTDLRNVKLRLFVVFA